MAQNNAVAGFNALNGVELSFLLPMNSKQFTMPQWKF